MSTQKVTPELRQWIIEQARTGQSPDKVLASMLASGWIQDVAIATLETTLADFLQNHAKTHELPAPTSVPEPQAFQDGVSVVIDGHEIKRLMWMRQPHVMVLAHMLSDSECDGLIQLAQPRLGVSQVVDNTKDKGQESPDRTSQGMFFHREENALCARIEARIAKLLHWPLDHGEGLQVLRYAQGAQYKPHYDYFDPTQASTSLLLTRGGQRVASLIMYLNTPPKGGATVFPDLNLEIAPIKGHAVFFSYDRAHPMTKTLHGGAPVLQGEKWVITKWLRERKFE
jgi:prolyl 4-hydroxylase